MVIVCRPVVVWESHQKLGSVNWLHRREVIYNRSPTFHESVKIPANEVSDIVTYRKLRICNLLFDSAQSISLQQCSSIEIRTLSRSTTWLYLERGRLKGGKLSPSRYFQWAALLKCEFRCSRETSISLVIALSQLDISKTLSNPNHQNEA